MGKSGKPSVVLMVSGEPGVDRDIPNEEKYQGLATAFVQQGFDLHPVVYHDSRADGLREDLQEFDAILVWVNPLEKGRDRSMLDPLLLELAKKGSYVSAHPDVILKMGTKEVLYKTRSIGWSGDVNLYRTFEDFRTGFPESMGRTGTRVLKQNRGNGGNGVFKVTQQRSTGMFSVAHALGNEVRVHSARSFYDEFARYFSKGGMLIDQEWNDGIKNGMVRCYISGRRVAGFGYQEINALYSHTLDGEEVFLPPGKRHYYTENCGLFTNLRLAMEQIWIPQIQQNLSIPDEQLPVIWDADFFICDPGSSDALRKYMLCEINVSSVSPFPPSAVPHMIRTVRERI